MSNNTKLSCRAAAVKFSVSRTTLRNWQLEKTKPPAKAHEHQQLLTESQENELVQWIQQLDDIGIPPRLPYLEEMARQVVQSVEGDHGTAIGEHWISRFLDRHPNISSRFTSQIPQEREAATQPMAMNSFFDWFSEVKSRYCIGPDDTWNADEKGFAIGVAKQVKVLCQVPCRNPRIRHPGNRELVTLFESISATGRIVLCPLFIYLGQAHLMGNHDYEGRDSSTFALSDTGWTNNNLGLQWLKEVFELETCRPRSSHHRLLLIDGHSSHLTLKFIEFALDHNIHLLCFPPHSTHVLQPLDVGIFGPLGTYYSNEVDCWMRAHPYQAIGKGDFYPLCQKARAQALRQSNIKAAFAATGLAPYRRGRVMTLIDKSQVGPPLKNNNMHWQLLSLQASSAQNSSPTIEPGTAREVQLLKIKIEDSDDIDKVKALGLALGSAAGKSMTATTIA